ncbi:hypothetical protein BI364_13590 [Acidihalobacter yilgarnensis]|uniref:Winged helix-turn helix domain-containing protein n=1 Tax=Acidihalobacter yilgarnensis TaxID=2819280 RepID=A0A1D8IR46_9GAMM|nr:hypothetical protein BI364_13590 [Acidihalobacter yilgarnensis]
MFRWVNGKNPWQYSFDFGLWTRQIVGELITQRLGVMLGLASVGALLARVRLTPQKPLQRAYQLDPEAIARWQQGDLPRHRPPSQARRDLHLLLIRRRWQQEPERFALLNHKPGQITATISATAVTANKSTIRSKLSVLASSGRSLSGVGMGDSPTATEYAENHPMD